eukprot:TRINITY_DN932_c0_g1_i1.p1 TRINITY_DN932_c0_g1~~TRINITY_DN932_c0_g1_i1.p1  ORF type:complete len:366 (-),score=82.82 TRINITY_DN932_c0_g1_i1:566-1663(-)
MAPDPAKLGVVCACPNTNGVLLGAAKPPDPNPPGVDSAVPNIPGAPPSPAGAGVGAPKNAGPDAAPVAAAEAAPDELKPKKDVDAAADETGGAGDANWNALTPADDDEAVEKGPASPLKPPLVALAVTLKLPNPPALLEALELSGAEPKSKDDDAAGAAPELRLKPKGGGEDADEDADGVLKAPADVAGAADDDGPKLKIGNAEAELLAVPPEAGAAGPLSLRARFLLLPPSSAEAEAPAAPAVVATAKGFGVEPTRAPNERGFSAEDFSGEGSSTSFLSLAPAIGGSAIGNPNFPPPPWPNAAPTAAVSPELLPLENPKPRNPLGFWAGSFWALSSSSSLLVFSASFLSASGSKPSVSSTSLGP